MYTTPIREFTATGAIVEKTIVKMSGDFQVAAAAAETDKLYGIVMPFYSVASGQRVEVQVAGSAELTLGGTVAAGDPITSDANGCGIEAVHHTHTENTAVAYTQNATTGVAQATRIVGFADQAGVAGDIIHVRLAPGFI